MARAFIEGSMRLSGTGRHRTHTPPARCHCHRPPSPALRPPTRHPASPAPTQLRAPSPSSVPPPTTNPLGCGYALARRKCPWQSRARRAGGSGRRPRRGSAQPPPAALARAPARHTHLASVAPHARRAIALRNRGADGQRRRTPPAANPREARAASAPALLLRQNLSPVIVTYCG
jgi:hypothetical protein